MTAKRNGDVHGNAYQYTGIDFLSARPAALGLALASVANLAVAADWYGAINGGAVFAQTVRGFPSSGVVKADFDTGYSYSGAVGAVADNYRAEAELLWSSVHVGKLKNVSVRTENGRGYVSTAAAMLNVYADFPGLLPKVTPFVGVGAGVARVKFRDVGSGRTNFATDHDEVLAFQAKAGVAYSIDPATDITFSYRVFGTQTPNFKSKAGLDFETDGLVNQHVEAGLRRRF